MNVNLTEGVTEYTSLLVTPFADNKGLKKALLLFKSVTVANMKHC